MIDKKVLEYSETLKKLGIENKIFEHPHLEKANEVVANLGYTLDDSAATLIMKADDNFVAIIRRDVTRISFKKIRKILNASTLGIATSEEFVKVTGLQVGTARFYVGNVKTLIDKKVFEKEFVLGGTGSFTHTIQCKSEDLRKLPNSQVVDITTSVEERSVDRGIIKRVFSGIRATGRLHLGNYLGAVKGMLEIQNKGEYETIYCVVDVHSITTPYNKTLLAKNKREIIIDYLAAGLDPKKSILIYQSDVPEHMELAFYFSTVLPVARMLHLPTYKDKIKQYPKNVSMALLNYPVLMAADILIYKASLVPVGIDQEPHLEVAREVARKMNQLYGTDFPEPVRFATKGEYIPSLTGTGKMAKTVEGSYINLTDSLEEIRKKVRSIPTATKSGGEMTPGVRTLFAFAQLFIPNEVEKYKKEYENGTLQFVTLKDTVAKAIYKELKPFQESREKIAADQKYVDDVIKDGASRARKIARETVKEVKHAMGLS
ncbi:tryptophan--tRNA ligase [Candidatus Roizmanbacteria bacterium CG02_land_8_20_14_3_00_36_15]|uniref:Tryptophan--tRNA ligase n=1 Tax=Candidatus Roizmanbacteria bacterium CG_4_8_14_3_um_filter_36_10 TaxID=1974834 RepID=A0A2M8GMR0_9BACT|nr:MAG: tryptophan--tRNA ligase [Candidatus Roizmanbacteria bacterium CG03_land_8_20_14_0_80_36_21]PIV38220.1 MAG: tryptophan--tRNA ligase [Candidatus Roizmanbacteria bacterium CG02_land_8_20_14_3_00_36_15]PJC81843.1 MAG: tryptophan--tRNA ligase [Candidatus Roizmanbacteria bacterium CG_4_8_14_3_um_filter_36_10]